MRVRPERDYRAPALGFDEMTPIEIEPVRIRIQLDGNAHVSRLLDHRVDVDRVRLTREKQTTSRMRQNGEKWIVEGVEHALRHRRTIHAEARMDRADHEVDMRELAAAIVESPNGEDGRI